VGTRVSSANYDRFCASRIQGDPSAYDERSTMIGPERSSMGAAQLAQKSSQPKSRKGPSGKKNSPCPGHGKGRVRVIDLNNVESSYSHLIEIYSDLIKIKATFGKEKHF
jgi:hypothetical protein